MGYVTIYITVRLLRLNRQISGHKYCLDTRDAERNGAVILCTVYIYIYIYIYIYTGHKISTYIYRVIQEESSLLWEMIV